MMCFSLIFFNHTECVNTLRLNLIFNRLKDDGAVMIKKSLTVVEEVVGGGGAQF